MDGGSRWAYEAFFSLRQMVERPAAPPREAGQSRCRCAGPRQPDSDDGPLADGDWQRPISRRRRPSRLRGTGPRMSRTPASRNRARGLSSPPHIPVRDAATSCGPPHADPRIAAGAPLTNDILKCELKPIEATDYPLPFTTAQMVRLKALFSTRRVRLQPAGESGRDRLTRHGYGTRRLEPRCAADAAIRGSVSANPSRLLVYRVRNCRVVCQPDRCGNGRTGAGTGR